ncbi:SDR family NAD(P)-dependent oxidoreductase [Brevundimonas sp.]|jgi:NAD(P)-dependent dehydrogenase (short-subunit alcohol dehydrogenase family)|uniref:SDR family NAD(P)-dependent oxidoreductase n=1 Tax=Brevundimonas sp. TaxID=1871086 RepID=UPI003784C4AE
MPGLEALRGRTALITGGASGIGLGLARALAHRGMMVVLADIDADAARRAAVGIEESGAKALGLALDVRDPDGWTTTLDAAEAAFGPLSFLCSNAGVAGSVRPLTETTAEGWDWTMDVNLRGAFNAIRHGVPRLKASGSPAWFVATSSLAPFSPSAHNGVYAASKAAVISLCESLRVELAGGPVGVSVLVPGLVKTGLLAHSDHLAPSDADAGRHSAKVEAAMAAAVSPDLIAKAVLAGVVQGAFWLFPDPLSRALIESHMADMLSGLAD